MRMSARSAQIKLHFLILVTILFVWACGPKPVPTPTPTIVLDVAAPVLSAKPLWEEEWEATRNAARKEGRVLVYTLYGADWRSAMGEVMLRKYGITLDTLVGRSGEVIERVMREQQRNLYQADVLTRVISAPSYVQTFESAKILQSVDKALVLPEVVDPKVWWGGKLPWFDPDTKTLFFFSVYASAPLIVNTDLVRPGEIKSWDDLLHPKWKGQLIINDPTTSGPGNSVVALLAYGMKNWDYISHLLKQEPFILRDDRLMMEWVAKGKYPILIGVRKEWASQFMAEGAPLKYVGLQEVILGSGAGSVALPKGSPNPNAAKVFINFFLSKEGQTITAKTGGYPSSRLDVPTDFLDPSILRPEVQQPGTKYFFTDDRGYLSAKGDIDRKIKQVFEPFMKR